MKLKTIYKFEKTYFPKNCKEKRQKEMQENPEEWGKFSENGWRKTERETIQNHLLKPKPF